MLASVGVLNEAEVAGVVEHLEIQLRKLKFQQRILTSSLQMPSSTSRI
jgi:hypothetical protein